MTLPATLHASAVAIDGHGLLLIGPSGAGKSDLALRLIDVGATLVADDRVIAEARAGRLHLSAPAGIAGLIELRGVGIVRLPFGHAPARLVLRLGEPVSRLPAPETMLIAGIALPCLNLDPFQPSAVNKARHAMALAAANRLWSADEYG